MKHYLAQSLEQSAQAAAGILALMLLLILASVLALVVINPARPFGPLLAAFFTPIKQQKDPKDDETYHSQAQFLPHQTPPAYPTWERQHHQPTQPPLESDLLWLLSHLHPPERQQSHS